jgi:hypothetical protein
VSKSTTLPNPQIGHSRHGLFFTRLNCQSNAKPSEKDHDLPGIRARGLWSSSQHTQPPHHLIRLCVTFFYVLLSYNLFVYTKIIKKKSGFLNIF